MNSIDVKMYKFIVPLSLFMLVRLVNYSPIPSTIPYPILNNCVPERGARRHLCSDCLNSWDAAKFSDERDDEQYLNTVFQQGRVGEWWVGMWW